MRVACERGGGGGSGAPWSRHAGVAPGVQAGRGSGGERRSSRRRGKQALVSHERACSESTCRPQACGRRACSRRTHGERACGAALRLTPAARAPPASSCSSDTGSSASLLCDVECDLDYASLVGHIGRQVDAAGIAKGTWLPEEDRILIAYVERHGPKDWNALLTKGLLKRNGKSCRLRWVNQLQPGLQRGHHGKGTKRFTEAEERRVVELQSSSASTSASSDGTSVTRCAVDPGTTAAAHVECSRRECLQKGVEQPAVHLQQAPILCSQCCAPQAPPPCDAILASPGLTAPVHWEIPACSSGSGVTTTGNDMLVHNDWDYEELLHSLGLQFEDTKVPPTPGARLSCAEGRQDLLWQELEGLAESNLDVLSVTGDWQSKFC
eukprot:SM000020S05964  [mRNA]  locus=s20:162966:164788:+ [translate_table: standard]